MAADINTQDESSTISAINITPFVDVVLVLLIIFIVTAPNLIQDKLNIELPQTKSGTGETPSIIAVAVNAQGNILLNGVLVDESNFIEAVRELKKQNSEVNSVIAADKSVAYEKVAHAIDLLNQAGIERIALQVEREPSEPK